LTDIHANLRSEFDELWDHVSSDGRKDADKEEKKHKGGMKKKKQMTDRELP
jgi:hypothetical protein